MHALRVFPVSVVCHREICVVAGILSPDHGVFFMHSEKHAGCVSGWGMAAALRRRSARARCWAWRCALVVLLLLPLMEMMPRAIKQWRMRMAVPIKLNPEVSRRFVSDTTAWGVLQTYDVVMEGVKQRHAKAQMPETRQPPWEGARLTLADWRRTPWLEIERWLPVVWWGVAGMAGVWFLARMVAGRWWLRRGSMQPDWTPRQASVIAQAVREMKLVSKFQIRISSRARFPLLAGIWRPAVYLPLAAADWEAERLRMVFLHELAHWRRRDPLWLLMGRLGACLFWWNPLAAFAVRRMCREAEEAADDEVVLREVSAPNYAETLVEIAASPSNGSLAAGAVELAGVSMVLKKSALEKRIRALLTPSRWRGRVGYFAACAILILGGMSAGAAVLLVRNSAVAQTISKNERKLTGEERVLLERIRDNTKRRLHELRYVHVKLEKIFGEEKYGDRAVAPQPSKIEAWADLWTNRYRMQKRPDVFVFVRQPGEREHSLGIDDEDKISDGKHGYRMRLAEARDDDRWDGIVFPGELSRMLAYEKQVTLWERANALLGQDSVTEKMPDGSPDGVSAITKEGKTMIRIAEASKMATPSSVEIFEVDPALDDLLVYYDKEYKRKDFSSLIFWTLR